MKFFDLEMNSYLARVSKRRGGGRSQTVIFSGDVSVGGGPLGGSVTCSLQDFKMNEGDNTCYSDGAFWAVGVTLNCTPPEK